MSLQRISIINAKGGSGKSTIAMNLAVFFASAHHRTVILDYDPQGSCYHWNLQRPAFCVDIDVRDAVNLQSKQTRTFQLSLPAGIEHLIMDTPAGLTETRLSLFLQKSDIVMVPVAASALDVQASGQFLRTLVKEPRVRSGQVRIGVIINRLRSGSTVYRPLMQMLEGLKLPVIASLSDSQAYISLAERGMGIHDDSDMSVNKERNEWLAIARWLSLAESGVEQRDKPIPLFSPKLISNAH